MGDAAVEVDDADGGQTGCVLCAGRRRDS
jgi:hypothetical protein